ncbi:quinone oxidoreductase family protein [Cellulomonas bogoriensis]|uniref:NADPH--quinone reductase n=1 Tax=Cellulomonas bogoriensis 69B4 = DSM 16987 TaxID=1386082 RepID=A0A0A0BYJ8_9CELL|nr:quinone oxidoreductase [Cellulomonas bogoriensis]KGM13016.1 NADPH--quinone reductase [Cellulomonas bogoriensis 69B4 = DSM 16987]
MRTVQATRPGGPEVLAVTDVPTPEPAAGQVRVDVVAAGVNYIDTYRRSGTYPMTFPHVVGTEGAGVVSALGPGVGGVDVGDHVAWLTSNGSYAEQVLVKADHVVRVPPQVEDRTAAALMLQGMTAHYLVDSTFPVTAGQHVLVHAGAGGVGLLLTQLASARGATVLTTVSSDAKVQASRAAGATHVLRYDQMDDLTTELPAAVRDLTGGVHTVFDGVGAATFDASLACLRPRGGLALFGGASGQVPPLDPQRLAAAGSVYLTRPTVAHYTADPDELRRRAEELFAAVGDGSLRVHVGATYALDDAAEAHLALEGRRTTGKVLLLP